MTQTQAAPNPENTLVMTLASGTVTIELYPEIAPNHVARIKELTRQGFYDGLKFHRVIAGFMAQTGDPKGDGTGGSSLPDLKAEFSKLMFKRGTLGMARAASPNSANSQFFICLDRAEWLDGQYTVFGQVTEGMEHVDAVKKADPTNQSGMVKDPDKIVSLRIAADI